MIKNLNLFVTAVIAVCLLVVCALEKLSEGYPYDNYQKAFLGTIIVSTAIASIVWFVENSKNKY